MDKKKQSRRSRYACAPTVSLAQVMPNGILPNSGKKTSTKTSTAFSPPPSPDPTNAVSDTDDDNDAANLLDESSLLAALPTVKHDLKHDNNAGGGGDGGLTGLTEKESLLIWASAKAACSLSVSKAMAVALTHERNVGSTTLNITLAQLVGVKAPGLPDIVSIDVLPINTSIRTVREQLQNQLQDLLDRYHLGQAASMSLAPMALATSSRSSVSVLGIFRADQDGPASHALLDSVTRFPSELAATIVIKTLTS